MIGTFIVTGLFIWFLIALFRNTDWENSDISKWLHNL